MARLIDADALSIQVMDASYWDNQDEDVIWNLVQDAPIVDAVEVVRCKDCLFKLKPKQYGDLECGILRVPMKNDDFCSYGERRNDG
jgi:hypothetical protein